MAVKEAELTSYEIIKSGLAWTWNRLTKEKEWECYYEGEFESLYGGPKTVESGLAVLENPNDISTTNFFAVCSDFYVDAIFAESPEFVSEIPARQAFIDEVTPVLIKELTDAVRWRTIKGRGVLLIDSLGLRAIDPSHYFPLKLNFSVSNTAAHLLAYPYVSGMQQNVNNANTVLTDDRIRLVYYDPNGLSGTVRNDYEDRRFSGQGIGEIIDSGNADIRALITFGDGPKASYYGNAVDLVKDFSVRKAIVARILNRHGNPHLIAPDQTDKQLKVDDRGSVLFRDMNGQGYEYLTFDGQMSAQFELLKGQESQIYTLLGIPPVALGEDVGRGESGRARERLMFSALARITRLRHNVEQAVPAILDAMGAPAGDTAVVWQGDPLSTQEQRAASAERQFAAGLISRDEARRTLGYEETPEEGTEFSTQAVGDRGEV